MEKEQSCSPLQYDLSRDLLRPEDALKCLTGQLPDAIIPNPNARPCNNLDEYLIKSTVSSTKKKSSSDEQNLTPSSSKDSPIEKPRKPFAVPLVRNFDRILKKPSDSNATTSDSSNFGLVYQPRKKRPDIFTRTENIDSKAGPLMLLKNRMEQPIKVLIRRRRKVPYISRVIEYKGTLGLFDKHLNLYMKDVIESFSYKGEDDNIYKRARHRDNLIIRGDNIILIS